MTAPVWRNTSRLLSTMCDIIPVALMVTAISTVVTTVIVVVIVLVIVVVVIVVVAAVSVISTCVVHGVSIASGIVRQHRWTVFFVLRYIAVSPEND